MCRGGAVAAGGLRVRASTPEEVIGLLQTGDVTEVSLDHDLGLATDERERTGYDVLVFIEAALARGECAFPVPQIHIHSANPVAWRRMQQAIDSITRLRPT